MIEIVSYVFLVDNFREEDLDVKAMEDKVRVVDVPLAWFIAQLCDRVRNALIVS